MNKSKSLYVEGMLGLGDNIYQIPIIQHLAKNQMVYLRTPWPQLYYGIPNLKFIQPNTALRTQKKNIFKMRGQFSFNSPFNSERIRLCYVPFQRRGVPLYQGLVNSLPDSRRIDFEYFLKLTRPAAQQQKLAIIRPPTLRKEWKAPSRNPKPEYVQFAIDLLNKKGFKTAVVADINPPQEVYDGPRPERAGIYFEKGELTLLDMLLFFNQAQVVVGGVGFIAPLCIALGKPAVIIHGGAGGFNGPEMIDAPGAGTLTHVVPDEYCRCKIHNHACNKTISLEKLEESINSIV